MRPPLYWAVNNRFNQIDEDGHQMSHSESEYHVNETFRFLFTVSDYKEKYIQEWLDYVREYPDDPISCIALEHLNKLVNG